MALTPDMIDKILSEHKDLYRADDIDNNNNSIDLSDVKYDSKLPIFYADRINNVVNRRRINLLAIFIIIVITILFIRDLIKCFKNN